MSIYQSVLRTTLRVHALVYKHTDGLIGHRVLGVPCLMLRTRFDATATGMGPNDADYARLWNLVNDNNGNRYDAYQKKTTRPIPVVALSRKA